MGEKVIWVISFIFLFGERKGYFVYFFFFEMFCLSERDFLNCLVLYIKS